MLIKMKIIQSLLTLCIVTFMANAYGGRSTVPSKRMQNVIKKMEESFCKSKATKFDDMRVELCDNIEYSSSCSNKECEMNPSNINGIDSFIEYMAEFEDMFHEVRININDGILTMQYRKGKCKGTISYNILLEYDSEQ
eukprot:561910_1